MLDVVPLRYWQESVEGAARKEAEYEKLQVGHPEHESVGARCGGLSVDVESRDPDHGTGYVVEPVDGEQAQHVVFSAKLLAKRVKDDLTIFCESAKDKHNFRGDGIDYLADLLVTNEEIEN